jgi:RimJ/RimL family protein N-acetyltransferase
MMITPCLPLSPWRLRPYRAGDEALYIALFTDAEVMRHIEPPLSLERASRCATRALWHLGQPVPGFLHWVLEASDGRTGGLYCLTRLGKTWAGGDGGLGAMLLPEWRRHDAAVRGLRAIGDWALGPLGMARLHAEVASANRAALVTTRRCGFRFSHTRNDAPRTQCWVREAGPAAAC